MNYICKICDYESISNGGLQAHIAKVHKLKSKEYYDLYLKKEDEGICPTCGKPTKYRNITLGYLHHCSTRCSTLDNSVQVKTKETTYKLYGDTNYRNVEQSRKTCLEKYGVDNIRKSEQYKEYCKQVKRERYGDENYRDKEKFKQTCLERYGVDNPLKLAWVKALAKITAWTDTARKKRIATSIKKYGVSHPTKCEEVKLKNKLTKFLRYGDFNYNNQEKIKQTNLEKYGVEYVWQSDTIKDKIKNTNLERYGNTCVLASEYGKRKCKETWTQKYGVDNPSKDSTVKDKIKRILKNVWKNNKTELLTKIKNTKLLKYGDENYNNLTKSLETRKRNNSWGKSKPEEEFYEFLLTHFDSEDIFRNYNKDSRYPYHVDFYIKSLDMFIELNLFWMHGGHLFDDKNQDDIDILRLWEEKSVYHKSYISAIDTWTKYDKLKYYTAIKNNLNYFVLYSNEEINEFKTYLLQSIILSRRKREED